MRLAAILSLGVVFLPSFSESTVECDFTNNSRREFSEVSINTPGVRLEKSPQNFFPAIAAGPILTQKRKVPFMCQIKDFPFTRFFFPLPDVKCRHNERECLLSEERLLE
ncbi:hypothetical protein AVEN_229457-1 [Araneus ventricosus]|uniref:ZP domain-containing protein n=1 Tax=Araneus ventricosus TaxID=182803 RepID=A0A4Y2JL38_ARAVE|nr:hypothetical protein AVEN_229457-1 [Araneus ventricosus]